MIKDFLLIIVLIIFLIPSVSAVVINEVMPHSNNPWGGEWIELYNPTAENISLIGWKIGDLNSNDTISLMIPPQSFALIVDDDTITQDNKTGCEGFDIPNKSCIELAAIGNRLNNDNETVYLYNDSIFVDTFSWNISLKEGGQSWGRNNSLNWVLCFPTPGQENNCSQGGGQQQEEETIELDYPLKVDCNEEFSVEIKAHNFEDDIYDVKIDVLGEDEENIEGKVWDPDEDKWQSTTYYVYEILDVSGGEGSEDLKFKIEDYEGKAILRPRIRDIGTFDDYPIDVICDIQEESEIKIIDAPEEARFGDEIKVEIEVYRGDTAKYAVYVYVQDNNDKKVSNEINLHFDDKFETKTEMIELILKCKNEQGTYEIIAEGLDTKDKENIDLDFCEEQDEKTEETTSKSNTQETTTTTASTSSNYYPVTSNSILESDNFLISKIMPYILASISLLLVIYLIIKKI